MEAVLKLIRELAIYEKAEQEVTNTREQLVSDGFGDRPSFECLVAELDNSVVGFALFFPTYSTWKGKCLYLEDICVGEQHRGKGIGKALFKKLVDLSAERGVMRLSWQVLNWNEPAIQFYKKLQADFDGEWINCRIRFDQDQ